MMESYFKALQEKYDISAELLQLMQECYQESQKSWGRINEISSYNQLKVLNAFQKNQAGDFHLNGSTGYGYGDVGRDLFEKIWADVFKAERALVRASILSGTHAIAIALLGVLEPGDEFVSISGMPYDTLQKVIGHDKEPGTVAALGAKHIVVDVKDDDFD